MSLKEYQIDIYTGIKHRIGTKRHTNYREKLEKDLKKRTLQEIKKKIEDKKKLDMDCIRPCQEDEICNRKSGKCVKRTSNLGISILKKMDNNLVKEFRPELWNIVNMPRDNHCGYHGFIYASKVLLKNQYEIDFGKSLKELILELKSILIKTYKENDNGTNYNRILNNSNNWLEDVDLQVFADYFNLKIFVYDERLSSYENKNGIFTEISPFSKKGEMEKIFLYQTIDHYDVMIPKSYDINKEIEIPENVIITGDDLKKYLREKGIISEEYIVDEPNMDEREDDGDNFFEMDNEEIEDENKYSNEEESIIPSKNNFKSEIIKRNVLSDSEIKNIIKNKIDKKKIDKLKNFIN